MYFEDKTNRKKNTAALLLYTQLEHDKIIFQEQHHLLHVFGLFIIMLSFKQHFVFFLVEQYPLQFSTNEFIIYIYYELKNSFVSVSCERSKLSPRNLNSVVKKVADNTVMVVILTVTSTTKSYK